MYSSVDAGIRATVIASGVVGERVYLDNASVDRSRPESLPYCTYNPNLGTAPAVRGDSKVLTWTRQFQVDYWDLPESEDPAKVKAVRDALSGARFQVATGDSVRINIVGVDRVPEPQGDRLVHYSFTGEAVYGSNAV